ncbi:DNA polymerase III subunit epsilon [Agrobacterium rubi]|nr:DNA polymerase III subunit epsilon [Agrobacterium rubi]NTF24276.1 DNA polymerase III subunit epsilon [Agrobacterium rubi]
MLQEDRQHLQSSTSLSTGERIVVLDTETTGFYANKGDRIVEIGAVEFIGNRETGRTYHQYINPMGRRVDPGALEVHGLTDDFLKDKPSFRMIAQAFLEFIRGAKLVIHNAKFDMGFLNAELEKLGLPPLENEVCDSLSVARKMYPGQRNTLDALCSRLGVDNSGRDLHGALIDASLLGQVFVKMTRLDQLQLGESLGEDEEVGAINAPKTVMLARKKRPATAPISVPSAEAALHESFIEKKLKDSVWHILRNNSLTSTAA